MTGFVRCTHPLFTCQIDTLNTLKSLIQRLIRVLDNNDDNDYSPNKSACLYRASSCNIKRRHINFTTTNQFKKHRIAPLLEIKLCVNAQGSVTEAFHLLITPNKMFYRKMVLKSSLDYFSACHSFYYNINLCQYQVICVVEFYFCFNNRL